MRGAPRLAGFTLVEMAIVLTVMAILAGLALPNVKDAVYRADAAKIVSDVRAVKLAVEEFVQENGSLPRSGRWRQVPADLAPYLAGMPFEYKTVEYRLISNRRRGVVRLRVRYPRRDPIGAALARYRRPGEVRWTNRRTDFYIVR